MPSLYMTSIGKRAPLLFPYKNSYAIAKHLCREFQKYNVNGINADSDAHHTTQNRNANQVCIKCELALRGRYQCGHIVVGRICNILPKMYT